MPDQHLVRYYGAYSNRARGERRKAARGNPLPNAADTALPTRRSYADFAQEQESKDHELRAEAYEQGRPVDPHPDAFTPKTEADSAVDGIEFGKSLYCPVEGLRFHRTRLTGGQTDQVLG